MAQQEILRGGVDTAATAGLVAVFMDWVPAVTVLLLFAVTAIRLLNEISRYRADRKKRKADELKNDLDVDQG